MKELPYLKFYTGEYLTGDITICDMKTQGLFINICCYYWNRQGHYPLANAKQRFGKFENELNELIERDIIKIETDNIIIDFLDEQLKERESISVKRSIAGHKGGLAKAKQVSGKREAKRSNIEEKRGDKKRREKEDRIYRKFGKLSLSEKEFENLKTKGLTKTQIDAYCDSIENYKQNTKYNSLNLTIQSWWRLDKKRNPEVDNSVGNM